MKVLLLRDVKRLGSAGDVKEVADGYAANYLIPRGLAVQATPSILKEYQERQKARERKKAHEQESVENLANRLRTTVLTFIVRAGETGKLYGSITSSDIAARLAAEIGRPFDKRQILLEHPIRELGDHRVEIKLMSNQVAEVTVQVQAEGS